MTWYYLLERDVTNNMICSTNDLVLPTRKRCHSRSHRKTGWIISFAHQSHPLERDKGNDPLIHAKNTFFLLQLPYTVVYGHCPHNRFVGRGKGPSSRKFDTKKASEFLPAGHSSLLVQAGCYPERLMKQSILADKSDPGPRNVHK